MIVHEFNIFSIIYASYTVFFLPFPHYCVCLWHCLSLSIVPCRFRIVLSLLFYATVLLNCRFHHVASPCCYTVSIVFLYYVLSIVLCNRADFLISSVLIYRVTLSFVLSFLITLFYRVVLPCCFTVLLHGVLPIALLSSCYFTALFHRVVLPC